MRIAVIGTGNVGGTLGRRWAQAGHEVTFGARDSRAAETKALLAEAGPNSRTVSPQEAAQNSDILVFAIPWDAVHEVLAQLGDLSGKTVIDATNPLLPKLAGLALGTTSAAEKMAEWAPGAKVVKAFNTIGFNISANPIFGDKRALLFYCGDDSGAKQQVHQLASELGFEPHDAGPLTQARYIEAFAFLWISLSTRPEYGREFAFGMLKR
jgi:8-hydroxy-5-deazaflavin:NADPH oxidoreductase